MDKYLIVGLGNPGDEYAATRHNTGYMILDAFARASNIVFADKRYGYIADVSIRGRKVYLLKPTTFMNLSGNAVRYWLNKENIDVERMLVVVDDLSLPVGTMRLRAGGSAGGHNGLAHIQSVIGTDHYARLRVGIGNDYPRGAQVAYVLSSFSADEQAKMAPAIDMAMEAIRSFVLSGIDITMCNYNHRHTASEKKTETGSTSATPTPADSDI